MKKLILSFGVIFFFGLYSFFERRDPSGNNLISPAPAQNFNSSVQTVQNTPAVNYKDGSYTGNVADAFYGNIQVKTTIQNGKITDVQFLQYPNDRQRSIAINSQAMPYLKQEAIQAQNANVDIVSGATDTSQAFIQSLTSALTQAQK